MGSLRVYDLGFGLRVECLQTGFATGVFWGAYKDIMGMIMTGHTITEVPVKDRNPDNSNYIWVLVSQTLNPKPLCSASSGW